MRSFGGWSPGLRAAVTVAGTSAFMVLVAWATLIGPDQVFTGPGPTPASLSTTTETCIPLDATTGPGGTEVTPDNPDDLPFCEPPDTTRQDAEDLVRQADPPLWLRILVGTLELLLLIAIMVLIGFVVLSVARAVRRRAGALETRESVDFAVLDEPHRIAEQMAADAAEQDAALSGGEPRNAIVAAWSRFEVQGERAGVGRKASETSSEYVIRILDLVSADSGAVNRLAGLYREARFSEHEMTEGHRAEALDALAGVRRSLGVRA
ncbi:DUF4129 domain-containing protein [Nocardioides sp.]|uniref:DUF4129 domain-containing protein n=1 Tax=Nocardioides sp. TaxID=35761 RepID=UPI0026099CC9|nr:DUF4129 domain-containing protein [Nocardioides sp.]MCW2739095.1 hypothetical protein [Nocardioides sp.]